MLYAGVIYITLKIIVKFCLHGLDFKGQAEAAIWVQRAGPTNGRNQTRRFV